MKAKLITHPSMNPVCHNCGALKPQFVRWMRPQLGLSMHRICCCQAGCPCEECDGDEAACCFEITVNVPTNTGCKTVPTKSNDFIEVTGPGPNGTYCIGDANVCTWSGALGNDFYTISLYNNYYGGGPCASGNLVNDQDIGGTLTLGVGVSNGVPDPGSGNWEIQFRGDAALTSLININPGWVIDVSQSRTVGECSDDFDLTNLTDSTFSKVDAVNYEFDYTNGGTISVKPGACDTCGVEPPE